MEEIVAYERKFDFEGTEKDLELHLLDNIGRITESCGWGKTRRVENQYVIPSNHGSARLDVMLWHEDGTGTVIEAKKNYNRNNVLNSIGQLLYYGTLVEKRLGKMPRLVLAVNDVDASLKATIDRFGLPISILMLDGNTCLYFTNERG